MERAGAGQQEKAFHEQILKYLLHLSAFDIYLTIRIFSK